VGLDPALGKPRDAEIKPENGDPLAVGALRLEEGSLERR
jgi:hypothetical protein